MRKAEKVRDAGRDWRGVHAKDVAGAETQVGIGEQYMRKAEKGLKPQVETEDECNV